MSPAMASAGVLLAAARLSSAVETNAEQNGHDDSAIPGPPTEPNDEVRASSGCSADHRLSDAISLGYLP